MQRKILLVEDDHLQRGYVKQALEQEFGATVETLCCEKNFIEHFEEMAAAPPDVAVLDIMLMWARPMKHEAHLPPQGTTPERAGLRCADRLRHDSRTAEVKVVLYSVLPEDATSSELAAGVDRIVKEADCQNLIEAIRDWYRGPASSDQG